MACCTAFVLTLCLSQVSAWRRGLSTGSSLASTPASTYTWAPDISWMVRRPKTHNECCASLSWSCWNLNCCPREPVPSSRQLVSEEVGSQRVRVQAAFWLWANGWWRAQEAPQSLLPVPDGAAGARQSVAILPAAVLPAVHRPNRGGSETQGAVTGDPAAGQVSLKTLNQIPTRGFNSFGDNTLTFAFTVLVCFSPLIQYFAETDEIIKMKGIKMYVN